MHRKVSAATHSTTIGVELGGAEDGFMECDGNATPAGQEAWTAQRRTVDEDEDSQAERAAGAGLEAESCVSPELPD